MRVRNLHARRIDVHPGKVAELMDSLSGEHDRLWPRSEWPPMTFDRLLAVGATGGHGPVRYSVVEYEPGRRIRFQFDAPRGFEGYHEFRVDESAPGTTTLSHLLAMETRSTALATWPLVFRPLHDALIEECLDTAELTATGWVRESYRRTLYQRLLRRIIAAIGT